MNTFQIQFKVKRTFLNVIKTYREEKFTQIYSGMKNNALHMYIYLKIEVSAEMRSLRRDRKTSADGADPEVHIGLPSGLPEILG